MSKLIILLLVIWGVFNANIASWVFIAFVLVLESIGALTQYSGKTIHSDKLSERENKLLRKYNVSIRYPLVSKNMSATLSAVQLSTFIWIPLLIFKKDYAQAIIVGLSYFPAGLLSQKLNPRFFLDQAAKKYKGLPALTAAMERDEITALMEKLYSKPHSGSNNLSKTD